MQQQLPAVRAQAEHRLPSPQCGTRPQRQCTAESRFRRKPAGRARSGLSCRQGRGLGWRRVFGGPGLRAQPTREWPLPRRGVTRLLLHVAGCWQMQLSGRWWQLRAARRGARAATRSGENSLPGGPPLTWRSSFPTLRRLRMLTRLPRPLQAQRRAGPRQTFRRLAAAARPPKRCPPPPSACPKQLPCAVFPCRTAWRVPAAGL